MDVLMWKYALMAFIQCMASAGSPEKSAGSAALISGVAVDMGVIDGVEGVVVVFRSAGGKLVVDVVWGYSRVQRSWGSKGILRLLWKSRGEVGARVIFPIA